MDHLQNTSSASSTHMLARHVVCVGFMGAGKTTVGRALAENLRCDFVDLDVLIEQKYGKSVSEIFNAWGEAVFRLCERSVLEKIIQTHAPCVVSTGGGSFLNDDVRASLLASTDTVFLDTDIDVLEKRLITHMSIQKRPLLQVKNPREEIRRLYADRRPVYEQALIHVKVKNESVSRTVSCVISSLKKAYAVETSSDRFLWVSSSSRTYPVIFKKTLGPWFVDWLKKQISFNRIFVVTDQNVEKLHAAKLCDLLRGCGYDTYVHVVNPGESSKTWLVAGEVCDALLKQGITRSDVLLALGGGVVGDLTGFVASVLLRGIPYVQIPTSTLACVDSSVGGKTAVNTSLGKNLLGAFYPPHMVCVVAEHLLTQSLRMHSAGLVEAVKIAFCVDKTLYEDIDASAEALLAYDHEKMLDILFRAVSLKAGIVARDEHEKGERAVLNFGHTIGHAIEIAEAYQFLHGEAVALGMLAEQNFCEWSGVSASYAEKLESTLKKIKAPTEWQKVRVSPQALMQDKKRQGEHVVYPLIPSLGDFVLTHIKLSNLEKFLHERMSV